MSTPDAAATPVEIRDSEESPGTRRWLDVGVLWVAAVGAQALIIFLLAQFQLQQGQAWTLDQIASALRAGDIERADGLGSSPWSFVYPTELLIRFSLVGLAVIALAWTGRRALAWALPFAVAIVSISPAYWGHGALAPHPLGEGADWNLWGSLVLRPATPNVDGVPTWPLVLGVAVQTALLLLPLVAAPARHAVVTMASAFRRAAIPTAAVALVVMASVEYPSVDELYRVPGAALVLGFVAGAVATGAGSAMARIPAAIAVPAIIGPILLSNFSDNTRQYVLLSLAIACGAAFIVLGTLAAPRVHERFTTLRHADPAVPASV
jgi:hypothetical protein